MELKQGDCLKLMQDIPSESIDLILTDPPYGIDKEGILNDDSLETYYSALPEFYRILKNNAFFITFASIGRLPDFFKNNPFAYRWQYIIYINNGMVRGSLGFNRFMCILFFQKGEAKLKKQMSDVFECSTSSQQAAKRQHPTEKPIKVVRKLIDATTQEGDIVLDPFMGSGTTGIAASTYAETSSDLNCQRNTLRLQKSG